MQETQTEQETATALLAQFGGAPLKVARMVPSDRLVDYYEMAGIGMEMLTCETLTLDATGQETGRTLTSSTDACPIEGTAKAAFDATFKQVVDAVVAPAAAAGVTGYLVQGSGGAGLLLPSPEKPALIRFAKEIIRTGDCHCS